MEPVARRLAREWIEKAEDCPDHVRMYVEELEGLHAGLQAAYKGLQEEARWLSSELENRELAETAKSSSDKKVLEKDLTGD